MFCTRLEEQTRLSLEVVEHVSVIVEVVTRQVGKQHCLETNTIDASLRQCMRRNFNGGELRTLIDEPGQAFVQFNRRRRRHRPRAMNLIDAVTQCAEIRAPLAEQSSALRNKPGNGCLAVRACHADNA